MKKDIDSTTVRRNLRSNTVRERYWKTKISFIVILFVVMLIIGGLCRNNKSNSSEKKEKDINNVVEVIKPQTENGTANQSQNVVKINASGLTVSDVYTDFKSKMAAKTHSGITYSFINLKKTFIAGKYDFICEIQETDNGFSNFSLVFNPINMFPESKQSVLQKNAGAQALGDGVIDKYEYHLIGLK